MTVLTNSFEGGTNTTAISSANSGGTSGNAFDVIVSTAPTFDNTHAAHGTLAAHCAGGLVEWSTSMGTLAQAWYRLYLYSAATPGASTDIVITRTSGNVIVGDLNYTTSNTLILQNSVGNIHTMATTIPLNQWIRLEGFFIGSATVGQMELKIFLTMDGTTADETFTSAANLNTQASMTQYEFGAVSSLTPVWLDDLGLSSTGYLGPVTPTPVPVVVPSLQGAVTSMAGLGQAIATASQW